jgi:hypothetical protein
MQSEQSALRPPKQKGAFAMSATSFDVHTFGRQVPAVPRTPIAAMFARQLEEREAAVAEREADIARRERSLESIERVRELKEAGARVAPAITHRVANALRPFDYASQLRFEETFKLREVEWWRKQLGAVPVLR